MAHNPENLERPNKSEKQPNRTASPATVKALGKTAVKGANKSDGTSRQSPGGRDFGPAPQALFRPMPAATSSGRRQGHSTISACTGSVPACSTSDIGIEPRRRGRGRGQGQTSGYGDHPLLMGTAINPPGTGPGRYQTCPVIRSSQTCS